MLNFVKMRPEAPAGPRLWGCLAFLMPCFLAIQGNAARAEPLTLDRLEHIHGLVVDAEQTERLYLATHSGLFLASPDGTATRVGGAQDDFMSFAADPEDPSAFYTSGHPPGGGNLGILVSRDRGESWERLADGAGGPVDFHAMDVSRADSNVIYGMYKGLQVSRDGGRTWSIVGALPEGTFDLAASARNPDKLYVAARGGLFVSEDGGGSWAPATLQRRPATLVHVAKDGRVYAFVYGVGLLAGDEEEGRWELRSDRFADRYLIHMASDPAKPDVLHVVSDTGAIVTSADGGRTWVSYAGHHRESPERVAEGGRLYGRLCQSCHGAEGVGERPETPHSTDEYGFVAPPLDDTSHGWHHGDDDLVRTILNGSPRNPRMISFRELVTEDKARNLVAYIKSLWSFRSLACQGARHMTCMH
jgi:mono/diheme cytochrome c family protein